MTDDQIETSGTIWLGAVAILFALLLLANQSNELLKQIVITPGSAAELGIAANCREDELEEEGLSLQECQLMVSSVQITLASSPSWYRSFQIVWSAVGSVAAVLCLLVSFAYINGNRVRHKLAIFSFTLLLVLDVLGFFAAVNTGPLLRALTLSPLLLWFFIHLCLLIAVISNFQQSQRAGK